MTNAERLLAAETMTTRRRALWFSTLAELQASFLHIEMMDIVWRLDAAYVSLSTGPITHITRDRTRRVLLPTASMYYHIEREWPGFTALLPRTSDGLNALLNALMAKYNEDGSLRHAT